MRTEITFLVPVRKTTRRFITVAWVQALLELLHKIRYFRHEQFVHNANTM